MKRPLSLLSLLSAFLLSAVSLLAGPAAERITLAQKSLLDSVNSINVGGGALPGPLLVLGENAFPLASSRTYDGTLTFAAAGAFYGEGRTLCLSHPGFLEAPNQRDDTARLLQNALRWLAKEKPAPRIVVLRNPAATDMVRGLGYENVTLAESFSLADPPDILLTTGFFKHEVDDAKAYVERGGGLLLANLGWGYLYYNKTACFAEDFADNQVTGPMGILMGDSGVNRIDGTFPAHRGSVPREASVELALRLVPYGAYASTLDYQRDGRLLAILLNALPSGVHPKAHEKLNEMFTKFSRGRIPSPEEPLRQHDVIERLALLNAKKEWLREPEKVWPASPLAAIYPGTCKPGTPILQKRVAIDLSIPRWHSTGVYSPAGQALTVTLPQEATTLGLLVRVGSTADDLTNNDEWKRAPMVTLEIPLQKATTTFATPFGGLVYIVVPSGAEKRIVEVELDGGIMAPWFKLGRDRIDDFLRDCAETGAPYGEIEGEQFILTSETRGLKRVQDPEWIARHWDRVMAACAELGQTAKRSSPERFCSDVQLTAGFLHNGYPMMCHINEQHFDLMIDQDWLSTQGEWGCYHEIGHNHQKGEWTPAGMTEVTVNLFTCYIMETVGGVVLRDDERYPLGPKQQARRIQKWKDRGRTFDAFKSDYFLALEMYYRIKEAYGWEVYKKAFARYQEPGFIRPKTDSEKWQTFALEMSRAANANLAAPLAAWSIPITRETLDACAHYPAAKDSIAP